MWKDFFYFTRTERQGILILAVLCILVFIGGWLIPDKENTATNDTEKFKKEYAEFMTSIQEKKLDAMVMRELYTKYKTAPTEGEKEKARKEYLDRRGVPESFRWQFFLKHI